MRVKCSRCFACVCTLYICMTELQVHFWGVFFRKCARPKKRSAVHWDRSCLRSSPFISYRLLGVLREVPSCEEYCGNLHKCFKFFLMLKQVAKCNANVSVILLLLKQHLFGFVLSAVVLGGSPTLRVWGAGSTAVEWRWRPGIMYRQFFVHPLQVFGCATLTTLVCGSFGTCGYRTEHLTDRLAFWLPRLLTRPVASIYYVCGNVFILNVGPSHCSVSIILLPHRLSVQPSTHLSIHSHVFFFYLSNSLCSLSHVFYLHAHGLSLKWNLPWSALHLFFFLNGILPK